VIAVDPEILLSGPAVRDACSAAPRELLEHAGIKP
jgi:hypothetical protein